MWSLHTRHRHLMLVGDAEALPAGHQDLHRPGGAEDRPDEVGHLLHEVLAVVEQEQQFLRCQQVAEAVTRGRPAQHDTATARPSRGLARYLTEGDQGPQ